MREGNKKTLKSISMI